MGKSSSLKKILREKKILRTACVFAFFCVCFLNLYFVIWGHNGWRYNSPPNKMRGEPKVVKNSLDIKMLI